MKNNLANLIINFKQNNRRALAKIITYVESNYFSEPKLVADLLAQIVIPPTKTLRLVVSGPPGVGKSTFINIFAKYLLEQNFRVAILAVDPSSEITHGSILADKTRMKDLLGDPRVFIRPSPSRGTLGGITPATYDIISILESFGFNMIIIETVGIGQSETLSWSLCDLFLVLMQPGSGDQIQAMKKGVLERADCVLINKSDGELIKLAAQNLQEIKSINQIINNKKLGYISTCSSLKNINIKQFGEFVNKFFTDIKLTEQQKNREFRIEKFIYYILEQKIIFEFKKLNLDKNLANLAQDIISNKNSLSSKTEEILTQDIFKNFLSSR